MNLEVNLVKTASIDSKLSRLLVRNRYRVENDTEALDSIVKFIADNISTFTASLTDQRFVTQLENLKNITITDLDCLRYVLATKGLDLWYHYVADVEANPDEVPAGSFEYNVLDRSNMTSSFIPFCTKVTQIQESSRLTDLYSKLVDIYGLFSGKIFAGMKNPVQSIVDSMKGDEDVLGSVPTSKSTYANSIFDFLKKDIRVITN